MANLRITELENAPLVSGSYILPASSTNSTFKVNFEQLSNWINQKEIKTYSDNYNLNSINNKTTIIFNNSDPIIFTISASGNSPIPIGTSIDLISLGYGSVTVSGDSEVTVNSSMGWTLRETYSKATATKINNNNWILSGDLWINPNAGCETNCLDQDITTEFYCYAGYAGSGCVSNNTITLSSNNSTIKANGKGALILNGTINSNMTNNYNLILDGYNINENTIPSLTDQNSARLSLVKKGTGTWKLTESSSYKGNTYIKSGIIIAAGDAQHNGAGIFGWGIYGWGSSDWMPIMIGNSENNINGIAAIKLNQNVQISRYFMSVPLGLGSNQTVILGGNNSTGVSYLTGASAIILARPITLSVPNGGTLSVAGVIVNDFNSPTVNYPITIGTNEDAGTVILSSSSSSYYGDTILKNGTLIITSSLWYSNSTGPLGAKSGMHPERLMIGNTDIRSSGKARFLISEDIFSAIVMKVNPLGINSTQKVIIGGSNTSGRAFFADSNSINLGRDITLESATGGTVEFTNYFNDITGQTYSDKNITIGTPGNNGTIIKSYRPIDTTGYVSIEHGSLVIEKLFINTNKIDMATFTSSTLTVNFVSEPTAGEQFVFFQGPTIGNYTPVLTGTTATGTYNSITSTLTIN